MDSKTLREIQAPIKENYKQHPEKAKVTLTATGKLGENLVCKVSTGKALVEAGLHKLAGGTGEFACSGDMLLESLVACAGVTLNAVATALNFKVNGGTVTAQGDLDFKGTLGVDKLAPVGFTSIRLSFHLDAPDLTEEQKVRYSTSNFLILSIRHRY